MFCVKSTTHRVSTRKHIHMRVNIVTHRNIHRRVPGVMVLMVMVIGVVVVMVIGVVVVVGVVMMVVVAVVVVVIDHFYKSIRRHKYSCTSVCNSWHAASN